MASFAEAIEKVSELKSRWAILHELVVYLETHYKSSDAGEPELRVTREDYAAVPERHIDAEIANLMMQMDQIQQEIDEWGKLRLTAPSEEEPSAKAVGGKKRKRATQRQGQDQSPAGDGGQEGSGQAA